MREPRGADVWKGMEVMEGDGEVVGTGMKTRITELLGTEYPLIQGGMAWVAECRLAAAVSEAGGFGIIGAGAAPAQFVREQIRQCRAMTDNPGRYMADWKAAGVKVVPVVASVAMARMMERAGADAVVAEGTEAGGHIGSTTTMALVPQVADAVEIPVIAAGGIGDGRGFAAAFMLGAEAVQMGTRFLVAKESIAHEAYKKKVIAAKDIDSEVTGMSHGHPVRQLRNRMTREYLKLEKEGASFEELEQLTVGALRRAVLEGDAVNGTLMAGQIAGLVSREQTCREIIEEVMGQAADLLQGRGA